MSSQPTMVPPPTPQEPSFTGMILSYLVPGLGQICQGRYGKGLLFMIALLGMFFLGQAMGQWQNVYVPATTMDGQRHRGNLITSLSVRWHYIGQFWIGVAAWPALWQFFEMPVPNKETAPFWHNYQKAPDENELNRQLVKSDKTPDLGWVYTVIAGMLNILVMYDAYAGAAFGLTRPTTKPQPQLGGTATVKKEGVA
jgi:hypothetical protein